MRRLSFLTTLSLAVGWACSPVESSEAPDAMPVPAADVDPATPSAADAGAEAEAQHALRAFYTRIDSGAPWEAQAFVGRYADLVVAVGDLGRLVFWRGASYRPRWETGQGQTYVTAQFETRGDGDGLRWDRLNRHAHVRLIRQGEGEVVVHWRYAPVLETGWAPMVPGWTGWVDEYYTVRADGRVRREVLAHDAGERRVFELALLPRGAITEVGAAREALDFAPPAISPSDRLPAGADRGFGASYQRLGYSGPWDRGPDDEYAPAAEAWDANWQTGEHPDVVVDFDGNPTQWVFWRGLGFVPSMVSENGAWFSNEFNESWGWPEMCEEGGAEPMNDKQARYSHVRVIENTPARVVVHWRYHPTGICYNLIDTAESPGGWGATSEFVFYIYPDGSALSQNTLFSQQVNTWGEAPHGFEYHEAMVMHGPGTLPSDNIEIHDTVTVMDLDEGRWVFDGAAGALNADAELAFPEGPANIARVNLAGTAFDTYTIMEPSPDNVLAPYWDDDFANSTPDGHFVSWDHWPVNQIRAFGRGSQANRYPSHTSLFHMYNGPRSGMGDTWQQRLFLTGLTDQGDDFVRRLGRAWITPPAVEATQGLAAVEYDKTERAWRLQGQGGPVAFTLAGSDERPVVNPAFVVRGWGRDQPGQVQVDGAPLSGAKQGVVYDTDGQPMLVVFLPLQTQDDVRIQIR